MLRLERKLRFANQLLEAFTRNGTVAFVVCDLQDIVTYVNQTFQDTFGWTEDESIGSALPLVPAELAEPFRHMLEGSNWTLPQHETWRRRKDGSRFPASVTVTPIRDEQGRVTAYASIIRDITQRKEAERQLKENELRYKSLFEHNPNAVFLLDPQGHCQSANPAVAHISGYEPEEMIGGPILSVILPEVREEFAQAFRDVSGGRTVYLETVIQHRSGRRVELHITMLPMKFESDVEGVYCIAQDITKRKQDERMINYMAYHDALTELPNRRMFYERLNAMLEQREVPETAQPEEESRHSGIKPAEGDQRLGANNRPGCGFAILLLDLDGFKGVNDTLGHGIGDETIRFAAKRMKHCVRDDDLVARTGGDEFVVLLPDVSNASQAAEVAERMIGELCKPFYVQGHSFTLSASIGIAIYPADGSDANSLMRTADIAMYRVKESGKNDYAFAASIEPVAFNSLAGMREALAKGQFMLYYQPLVDTATGRAIGFEALPRWRPGDGRLLLPEQFISIAEANGFIEELGEWTLRTACRQIGEWNEAWNAQLRLSVNVSIVQLRRKRTVQRLLRTLKELGFPPSLLTLEVNETGMFHDPEQAAGPIRELVEAGVQIAIDDFGSGLSSFAYLQQLPIRTLKIDRSLIAKLSGEKESAIVSSILHLADKLQLSVVVEGVETAEQRSALPSLGCRYMQGYYFSMPQPAEHFTAAFWNDLASGDPA